METSRTARQRAREEITAEILAAARTRLAASGPGELSLRAVARDVGMVSSAVYRYFPSRDELLTALLVEAYDELGSAVEVADDAIADRRDVHARWMASCRAARGWALAHPQDYALLFGTPVIGYVAPRNTVAPAARVIFRLLDIIATARDAGTDTPEPARDAPSDFSGSVADAIASIEAMTGAATDLPTETIGRGLMAWSSLFGVISFELWGHLVGSVNDHDAFFDGVAARLWRDLGGT